MITRRKFIETTALFGGGATLQSLLPAWARSGAANDATGLTAMSGSSFHLHAQRTEIAVDGRTTRAVTINGEVPAPLLRWREGDDITLHLMNGLDEDTSIHWHGVLLPPEMDGVPGLSFSGVKPGESFTYRFPVRQAGTYWYHSHSGLQEQSGHYGPIIIEPDGADPVAAERDYVIVLSDWTFQNPQRIFATLKKHSEGFNYQKRTLVDFARDAKSAGFGAAFRDRAMWGAMRMNPADIADVAGAAYTYLVNGHGPADNWTGLFTPGERVRLRIINASAMTIFNLRIPGLPMTVVQADGQNVRPVETDEIQIGVAETYDVVVHPHEDSAYTLMAETIDRSGYARATLAPRAGMAAIVPALRKRPTLTMRDMAMDHGGMNHSAVSGGASPASANAGHDMSGGHEGHDMAAQPAHADAAASQTHPHPTGAGVDMVAAMPASRLAEPGIGLEDVDHRVLTYAQLSALAMNPDMRAPERELELHLTGNMERYMWSFDGKKFSEVDAPIVFNEGERLRLTLVNDTMMSHPIHLHGMFFDVVTDASSHFKPRKHTIVVKPGEKLSVDITADAVGDWAFHCHLLYHMMAGMMQVVSVRSGDHREHQMQPRPEAPTDDHHGHHGSGE